ncbi:anti-sigma factor [Caulobacter hibisci]|uniref:Regulator of SigK n=1 Tax=Caulobacter hibisci TaxID=2035993 RepID=A0ABS0SZR0_9CAUL|nr:anti-sigma factor [Caulobacter hibisci]MBI1685122.1 anti-sigma factor [Caulobacter hibisci]
MTDATDIPPEGEERPLAGEYVLGVLDADERAEAQRRIAVEPAFARSVAWWEERLTSLAADTPSVIPSDGLWPRIQNLIVEPLKPSAWSNVALWRGLTAGALALAAASVVIAVLPRPAPPPVVAPTPAKPQAAEIAFIADPATNKPMVVATLDHATDQVMLTPMGMKMPEGRDAELWIIPEGQKAISLGVIPTNAPKRIPMPKDLRGAGTYTALLAVTDEPIGGSPTGVATGSVRAAGKFLRG